MSDDAPLELQPPPARVGELATAFETYVQRALGMGLDYSEESLALVDHYLSLAGTPTPELLALLAPAAGCYFGEVVRRKLGASWILDGDDPAGWRLELTPCPLVLCPVGMAAGAIAGGDVEGYEGSFHTTLALMPALEQALAGAAPMDEQTFYSLGGRLEAISLAADVLIALKLSSEPPESTAS